jgi:S-DNA-T family DNA segregation ATPase FtsK/SpoIIIE
VATEAQPDAEQSVPPIPDWDPPIEQTGPSRSDRAKAAFKEQAGHAAARTRDWLAGGDLDHVDVIQAATERKERKHAERIAQQESQVARLHARLHVAKMQAEMSEARGNASQLTALAGQVAGAESKLSTLQGQPVLPPTDQEINNARTGAKAKRAAILAGGGLMSLPMLGAAAEQAASGQPMLLAVLGTAAGYGWYLVSRPFDAGQLAPAPITEMQLAEPVEVKQEAGVREFNAPPPPALTVDQLEEALRKCGMVKGDDQLAILAVPQRGKDGNTTVVFDLPAGQKVAKLQDKIEEFAGALGRDSTMVDIEKAGSAVRTSLWITDEDPFEDTRPSPLITHKGGIDAFKDGVPVGWAKRGNPIYLPIRDSNFIIGGGTRSGKGVGAANLVVGSTLDVRVNHRIVAGKNNGEWDPYAKARVAGTYFKPNPERLLALLEALLADKNRREAVLGKLGKSKLVPQAIEGIGGLELLVIDELATYTRPGKPLREEILEALIEISAVAVGAGIFMVLITQYPSTDVIPTALAVNCTTKWAMRVDNADQSNAILGKGSSGAGRDASKFDPPRPGLGWMVNPFVGVTDKARSFDIDEDEREEVTLINERASKLREQAGRLTGQWEDPIEKHLLNATGLSSAAGGPKRDGIPGRNVLNHTPEQRMQMDALRGCLVAMDDLGRDVAQLKEMAEIIGGGVSETRLGELLRAAGAGGTVKITLPGRDGQVRGYRREDIQDALDLLLGQ